MNTKDGKSDLHNHHTANILTLHSAARKEYYFCRTGLFPVADSAS